MIRTRLQEQLESFITETQFGFRPNKSTAHATYVIRKMMDYAEAYAKSKNHKSIRLDTFSKNHRNNKFYKLRGYIKLDDVFFPNQSEFPFHCYEKLIN